MEQFPRNILLRLCREEIGVSPREKIARVGRKDVGVSGESESASASASWNAGLS